jgi:hypothetical protein
MAFYHVYPVTQECAFNAGIVQKVTQNCTVNLIKNISMKTIIFPRENRPD